MALGANANIVNILIRARDQTKAAFASAKTSIASTKAATGKLNTGLGGLRGGFSKLSSSLGSFGAALGPVGIAVAAVGVALATMGGAALKASLDFEKASATIRVGTGATGDALTGLEQSFKTVYTAVPASTADAATAIADLNTRLGLTGEPLESLATQVLNLSRITGTDVAAAISSTTRVMHDFTVSSEEQSGALDYLFKVSQSTGIGVTQLSSSMTKYGSVMRQMGFDINESAVLLGKFEKEGVNLELVLGSLRQGLANFSKAGEEPAEALARVTAEIIGMGSVADANALAIEVFGARAGPDMAAAMREGRFDIEKTMATIDASSETINKAAEDTMTFGDKWTLFKNKIMAAIVPVGDVILNVLGGAMEGLSAIFGAVHAIIGAHIAVWKALHGAILSAITTAIAPLTERIAELQQKFEEGTSKLTLFSDIFTIVSAGAKWLGEAIGLLLSMALTPLVAKLKDAIDMLTAFYDKLGPIKALMEGGKDLFGGVLEGIHNIAESTKETKEPIEELKKGLDELEEKGSKAPKAVADAWALAIKDFQEGTGSYKDAIGGIKEKITELTEEWMTASDERKAAIEKEVELLRREEAVLKETYETAVNALSDTNDKTEEAIEKQKEFTVTIGDTTIEFKGMAAEVVKNADAYDKLQKSAQTLIDLDWSTFSEFEAALPNIEAGIGDMESSFVGLKDILEENIDELENVKLAVIDISEIAAPFLQAGFLDGIKSIGDFAGALSDAGGAINTFAGLQDVSIEGCINFSMHVYDMVSALEILEDQMEDLVPAFLDMDSLIVSISEALIYSGGKGEEYTARLGHYFDALISDIEAGGVALDEVLIKTEELSKAGPEWPSGAAISEAFRAFDIPQDALRDIDDHLTSLGLTYEQRVNVILDVLSRGKEGFKEWADSILHDSSVVEKQLGKQTDALKFQTDQLSKITDALQPYLKFMRTLNELAALSTLSTEELNNGLNAINDTLNNLGTSLSTFDLRPVMESLFGTKTAAGEFTGGVAKGFTDTVHDYQGEFDMLIGYISRLSFAIDSLVFSFDALENVSESVLADETKLKDLFGELVRIMVNFSKGMGEEGFAETIATSMELMLKSAAPLISYFQKNNTEVKLFNSTLTTFTTTIKNVVDNMGMLKDMSEMVLPSVDELEAGFDKAEEAVSRYHEALLKHTGMDITANLFDEEAYKTNVFTGITNFAADWALIDEEMGTSNETFSKSITTITNLISSINSLVSAFQTLADMPLITSDQIVAGFERIKDTIEEVNKGMKAFAAEGLSDLTTYLKSVADMWTEWDMKLGESDETFGDAVTCITALVTAITDLIDAQKKLVELEGLSDTEWESFFYKLTEHVYNFYEGMEKFGEVGIDNLAYNLKGIEKVWASWIDALGKDSLTAFSDASSGIGGLIDSITSLVGAFVSLAEMPLMTADAFSAGMKDMVTNITNFAKALKDNIGTIEESLKRVDEAWSDNADEMNRLMPIFEDATSVFNTLAGGIMSVVRSFESLKEVKFEEVFATGFENLTNATGEFATALKSNIDGLLASLNALVNAWLANEDETVKLMRAFITISSNFMIVISYANALQDAFSSMGTKSDTLGEGFRKLTEFMKAVIEGVQKLYTADVAADLARFVIDVGLVIDALAGLETAINTAMGLIHTKIETTVNSAKNKVFELSGIHHDAGRWGADIVVSFVNGMKAMEFYLRDELVYIADLIAFYLGVGSNTKLGALSHLTDWPKNLVKTFADGIKKGTPGISKALSSLTLPSENLHIPGGYAGLLGGAGNTVTFYNTWNVDSRQNADYAISEMERMLTRKRVL